MIDFATDTIEAIYDYFADKGSDFVIYGPVPEYRIFHDCDLPEARERYHEQFDDALAHWLSYTPGEYICKALNEREDAEEAWQAAHDGVSEGINEEIERLDIDFFSFQDGYSQLQPGAVK